MGLRSIEIPLVRRHFGNFLSTSHPAAKAHKPRNFIELLQGGIWANRRKNERFSCFFDAVFNRFFSMLTSVLKLIFSIALFPFVLSPVVPRPSLSELDVF